MTQIQNNIIYDSSSLEDNMMHAIQGKWDILKDGKSLISFQSFLSFEEISRTKLTQYYIEENAFTTVNKVNEPKSFSLSLALQGKEFELLHTIKIIEEELKNPSIIQVLTPYGLTNSTSLVEKKISRQLKNGLGLIILDLKLEEIQFIENSYGQGKISIINAMRISDISFFDFGKQSVNILSSSLSSFF